MKILLVSYSILPKSGGSSVIVENLAMNFTKDKMIVLGSRGPSNNYLYDRPADGVVFKYFFSELSFFGRGARFFDWFRKIRFRTLINKIKNIISQEKIDHVIGVYPDPFYSLAASIASAELKVSFSSYFHNTYTENVAITNPSAHRIQKQIFDSSENIFVMSKGMEAFYEQKYKLGKFLPLVHTFNNYPDKSLDAGLPGTDKSTYKLVAIGNFNQSNLDATIRFLNAIKGNSKFTLSLYTHVPKLLLQNRGLNTRHFEFKGSVNPDKIHQELQQYDICILTHGFEGGYGEVEYQTIFPTRTIPFLLSGKPILAHSPKGSFLNSFIKEFNCAELIDVADEGEIVTGLNRITNDLNYQKQLIENAAKAAENFYGPSVVEKLKQTLEGKVGI